MVQFRVKNKFMEVAMGLLDTVHHAVHALVMYCVFC